MQLKIENMTCGGCANSVTKAIQSVDPAARSVKLETTATPAALQKVLKEAGYPIVVS